MYAEAEKDAMKQIPEPSRRRLVTLAALLSQQKTERITSVTIAGLTGWSQSLIRRDISLLELRSGVSNGYDVKKLHDAICAALNIALGAGNLKNGQSQTAHAAGAGAQSATNGRANTSSAHKCCIVGLGRLGAALLEERMFCQSPFCVVAGFDASVNRTEVLRSTFPLYPLGQLEAVIAREGIEYALLAVPESGAQLAAERLASCGIQGIVNYTRVVLTVPQSVTVENAAPVTALTNLLARANI